MKNHMFKRLLALAVAMVMVLGMLPELHLHAHAEGEEKVTVPQSEDWCGNPLCSQEDNVHVTSCAQYVAPENPVCYCVEKCAEPNIWCDVCGFDYTQCGGTDRAVGYGTGWEIEGTTLKVTGHLTALPVGVEYSKIEVHEGGNLDLGEATVTCNVNNYYGTISSGTFNTTDPVSNYSIISGGTFHADVNNEYGATISGGTFTKEVRSDGTITGGDFISWIINKGTITGGTIWYGTVTNKESGTISNAKFESNAKLAEGSTPPQSVIHSVNGEDVALTYNAALPAALGDANAWYQGDTQVTSGTVPLNYTTYVGEYAVNTAAATNGTVSVPATAKYGQTVTVTATAFEGYVLDTVTVQQGETAVTVTDNTFTMPAGAVTVTATFSADMSGIQPGYYLVGILNGENKWEVDSSASTRLLREDPGTAGQYYLNYSLSNGDKVKIAYFDGTTITQLFQADGKEAYAINTSKAGTVKILFRPEGDDSWSYTYFAVTPAYNVTVNTVENGTVSTDKAVATNGETVTLTVTPAEGYELVKLEVVAGSGSVDLDEENYTFTMPNQNVTVTAYFQSLGKRTVYFDNSAAQWSQVNIFFWSDSNNQMISWPGVGMIKAEGNIYSCQIPADAEYVIFNNGSSQTNDQILGDKNCCKGNVSGSTWYTYPCEHTYENGTCTACGKACEHTSTGENVATCVKKAVCDTCGVSYGEVDTTNHDSSVECVNGFCPNGCYEPATLNAAGYYEIDNAGKLFWFAQQVNVKGNREIKGVLTAHIDLENKPWTPIGATGENSNNFRGVFDGQGHTIKGLNVEGSENGVGFFGEVRTGTVKNFTIYGNVVVNTEVNYVGGVIGSICGVNGETSIEERNGAIIQNITSFVNVTAKAHGIGMIGGFVGYANHQSLIEQCAWYGTFDAGEYRVDSGAGGFIGKIQENTSEVTIRNCGAYGTIKTNYAGDYNNTPTIYMGGFLSFSNTNAQTTLENCLFAGRFERGENLTDEARLGAFGTLRSVNAIKNCYYLGDDSLEAVHSDSNLKPGSDNVEITSVTGEALRNNTIATQLGDLWEQDVHYPIPKDTKAHSDSATYTYTDNGDGTHKKTCNECGYVEEVKEEHYVGPTTTYTDNGDGTHSFKCAKCDADVTEAHKFTDGTCACGAACAHSNFDSTTGICGDCQASVAIAKVEIGGTTTYYLTADALREVVEKNSADQAVTLLADIEILALRFLTKETTNTLNLNGHTLTGSEPDVVLIVVDGCELTITGTGSIKFADLILMAANEEGAKIVVGGDVTLNGILRNLDGGILDLTGATIPEAGLTVKLQSASETNVSDVLLLPADYYFFVGGVAVSSFSETTTGTVLKHTEHSYTYTDNGDGTHDATCSVCGKMVDNEAHTIENHVCTACGAMEIVVSFNAGDFEWKTGDKLYFCRVSGDNEWEEYAFTATVAGDGTVTWTPDRTLYWDGTGEHKLVVVYPGDTPWAWDRFYVGDDQTTTEKLHEFDLMNAMWSGNPTTDPITLNLKHRLAKVTVNYEIAEGVTVSKAEVYTLTQYLLFDIHTLERKNIAWEEGHDLWINSYHNGNQFTAFVSPDAYAADGNFIKITLSDGSVREVKMNKAVTFEEGAEYTYKVVITADGAYLTCADECSFEYTANEDGLTHSKTCSKCGYVAASDAHTTEKDENKANCQHGDICDLCGTSYGEVDKTNHDSSVEYENGFCPNGCYEPAVLVDGVYQISNAGNLYWFADKVTNENAAYGSADAILTADITVNENVLAADGTANAGTFREWMPIGKVGFIDNKKVEYPYTGTFEGNGKTVSGLYFNDTSANFSVGLFSYVGEGGTVRNVGIADSYLCGGHSIGAVAGTNFGTVTNCYNTGTVSGTSSVGGVVGYNTGTVSDCHNSGTVSGEDEVGGVVGNNIVSSGGVYYNPIVTDCYNSGTVSGKDTVGGVVGNSRGDSIHKGIVTGCYNTGTVSGTDDIGGVVGLGNASNCYNTGTVSGTSDVGGVVGNCMGEASLMGCYNTGTVSGTTNVGGVAGYLMGDAILVGCYNTGTVSGEDEVGGVVGWNWNGTCTNCYFDSTVYTGNAIGTNEGTATNVEGKTTEQFASGEVAYLLSQGEKGDIWGQTIGTDPAPIFSDAKVYYGYRSCGDTEAGYTNEEATEEKPAHTQQPAYTDNHNGTHSAVYPCCGTTVSPKPHAMDTATGKCVCGLEMAEASVTIGGATTHYETLSEAISNVSTATADDNATVTLLKDNNAGQNVYGGVFTLDLNGKTLSSVQAKTTLNIYDATVTITDTLGGGEITGQDMGLNAQSSTLTIINTAITATEASGHGVYTSNCAVTIEGGTISGASQGVSADSGNLTIIDAEITGSGESGYGVNANNCAVTIEGGTIRGGYIGVNASGGNLTIKNAEVTCSSETGFAVNANHCAEVTIEGSTIDSNGTTCAGVLIYNCTNAAIKDTHITVTGTAGRGVEIEACTLTIQGCTVTSESIGVVAYTGSSVFLENSTVTGAEAVGSVGGEIRISGGSVTGSVFDLVGNVKLMLPASGTGTTFPGGITVTEANLDSILGEGAAYWQGSKMIVPEDGQREITGGDVTVKKACDHQGNTNKTCADNGDGTHSLTCSVCYAAFTEEHTQPLAYVNLEDEGHKAFYPCCQKAEDVAVSDHEYEGGYCACEDEQEFTLSFYANPDDQLPVATFSVPYGTELTMWESDEDDNETFLGATAYLENLISQITTVPQKEHYTFSGWDLEYGPIDMFGDESIYGLWTPVSYNITWDLAGGYADYPDELITTMRYNEGMILFTDFHKEGHTFSHLVDQNGLEFTREWRSDHWSLDPLMPGYDLTLTAVWDVNAYALHAQDQVLDVDYGTNPEDALAGITPEKTGYTHTGWKFYVDEGCTKEYTGTTMPAKELYAQPVFTPIEYNITWILNGCTVNTEIGKELPETLPYTGNTDTHQLLVVLDEPAGYKLEGFRDGNGNELSYSLGNGYLFLPVTGDMIVEAVIKPNSYVATWESADGGSYEKVFKFGETITIPDSEIFQETFRKAGHTLTGWEGYTEGMTMPIDGVSFTAVYAVNPYTITFDSDGGTAVAPITQDYGTAITAPSAPTKDGFHFSTWNPAIPETMPGEDTVLTAIWEAHKDYTYTASGDTITAFCGVCHQVVGTAKVHVTGKTYDATPVTATVTCTMDGVDAPQITYSGNINAGTYTASITLGDATAKADFTITPAVVTVRAEATSKIYGQGDPALNCTIQGLIGTDALSGSLSRAAGENAGSYAITVGTLANDNYTIDFIPANLTILPKTITVKADAVSKVYGQADPEFTYQAEGLVNDDKLTGELKREAGEDAGTYAITLGTLANSNYAIQFTGDKLTVTKAQQTITLDTGAVSLDCGKSAERTAQAEGAVTYSSSDASIVKVDASGKLTALKPGTVTITVTAAETGNYLPAQATYTVTVSHGHIAAVTAPTCEAKGYTTYTCPCGDSYVADYTDALGHDYKGKVTLEATCTAEGVMTYTCENDASHSYTEVIPVKAHTPKAAVEENRVGATCTEKGSYELATYCGVCGKELGRTQHTIDATGHDYDDGVITTQPSCETEVVKTFTCVNDKSHTYTEKVAPTGHSPKAAVEENRVEATCTEKGSYELATYCGVCGKELGRTQHEIPAKGHSFGSWTVVKAATCTEKGLERRDCSNCDHYETRATAFTGHSYRDAMDPSCEVCGEHRAVYVESIPMLRLYNPVTGEHHYTGSAQERDTLVSLGWNYEGVAWNAPVEFGDPVCRYYNPNTGDHHYTMCGIEGNNLVDEGWIYEGVAWNSASSEHLPIYRLYNPNAEIGAHHYTGSAEERDNLVAEGWKYEGIGWYALLY